MSIYYPVGTIVKLSISNDVLFMISGYLPRQGDNEIHDYFAVPFPMGLAKANQYISFNRNCIVDIVHKGFCDEQCENMLNGFDQLVENIKSSLSKKIDPMEHNHNSR